MNYSIYIIRTKNNKLYIGYSSNLKGRISDHKKKRGSNFLSNNKYPFDVVYTERYNTRIEAMRREKQLKGWTRAKKEALIAGNLELLKKL